MLNRRTLLLSLPAAIALGSHAYSEQDLLAAAFGRLPPSARRAAQERLSAGGFYVGSIDGVYGAGTNAGLVNAAAFVKHNSYDKVAFDLSSSADADRYLAALTSGELDKYLWGEGDEIEGG